MCQLAVRWLQRAWLAQLPWVSGLQTCTRCEGSAVHDGVCMHVRLVHVMRVVWAMNFHRLSGCILHV